MSELQIIVWTLKIIGVIFLIYCVKKHRNMLKCEWDTIAKFCGFMVLITALRFARMESDPPEFKDMFMSFGKFPYVFWEDAFFGMSIWFVKDHLKMSKKYWVTFAVLQSILFATLHLPYGIAWAICTLSGPYFLSYKYGVKHGFTTVMICHIIYDFITLLTIKLFLMLPSMIMV